MTHPSQIPLTFAPPVFRHYRKEDYDAVCDFLVELNRDGREHINWNWARFEWMYEHPECDRSLLCSIGLWLDGERVVGAAIYDMSFGEAFCGVLQEYADLYPEVLDYASRELKDENGLSIAICDDCEAERRAALAVGFSPAGQTETVMRYRLRIRGARLHHPRLAAAGRWPGRGHRGPGAGAGCTP